jgi:hypothetical protein
MKREDLAAMGLTEEQIEKVIAENGKELTLRQLKTMLNWNGYRALKKSLMP